MKKNNTTKILTYSALSLLIVSVVISALIGNTQTYFSFFSEPWMIFTIVDFYVLIALLSIWMWQKETKNITRIIYIILFITLGAIGVLIYMLSLIYRKKNIL